MPEEWPFDQPTDCAVITLRQIVDGSEAILHVTHNSYDHGWQFLGIGAPDEADACVVDLEEIVSIDPSVLLIADIPLGWHAWRESTAHRWMREPNPYDGTA